MKNIFVKIALSIGFASLLLVACDDNIDPIIDKIEYNRLFSPTDIKAIVRNQITVELSWTLQDSADFYTVEFSNDSLEFSSIIRTVKVLPDELPLQETFASEEQYSARIKGESNNGLVESKWTTISFKTDAENIFLPLADNKIGKNKATLNWPVDSEVTHFIITPGELRRDITTEEKAAGEASITELDFATEYEVVMYNGTNPKQRGAVTFTTLPEGITLAPSDDLNEIFANAEDGEIFLLEGGTYVTQGLINISKSITLKGLSSSNRPVLNVQFVILEGVTNVTISGLELRGKYTDTATSGDMLLDHTIQITPMDGTDLGNFEMTNCLVNQYNKSFIGASSGAWNISNVVVNSCVVDSIYGNGGDIIDFRKSFAENISIVNSTFSNCSIDGNKRQFIRYDGSDKGPNTYDDGSHTPTIEVNSCTFYNVLNYDNSSAQQFFYVRWINTDEVLISKNNLFVNMGTTTYGRDSRCETTQKTFGNNNYVNAAGFYDNSMKVYDDSSYTELDPGFADAINGDFTIINQTLIDNAVGDPRWR